ncbi:hypothetical protein N7403_31785 [Pseudomonas nitroreducens]|uniref:hypothetical protein n=1 Tax=Pseudomonas nitroreducens TaxID=46680 RepID=UPI00244C07E7|nr:hypothetical protein [Pseudomonas nitroreducens]MDG9858455.1 hypothetical protein [Pseudomonas nitroreducens]
METDFPEIEERFAADAWRDPVYVEHRITHEDLQAATEALIAAGGCITQVESGVQNAVGSQFNSRIVSTSPAGLLAAERQQDKAAQEVIRRFRSDSEVCDRIREALPAKPTRKEMLAILGISDKRMQRILSTYFPCVQAVAHLKSWWKDHDKSKRRASEEAEIERKLLTGRVVKIGNVEHKFCSHCKTAKPISEYYQSSSRASGLTTYCIDCERIKAAKRWRERNQEVAHEQPSAA